MNKLKQVLNRLLAFLPTPVPNGMTDFEDWATSIIEMYDFPNNDSIRFALATMIMHGGATEDRKPKRYYGKCVRAAMSKQVAGGVFQQLKERQQAAAVEQQKQEATKLEVVANGPETA